VPLDKYREKRNFAKTPEPKGDEAPRKRRAKSKALFFCVQKHLASHLHYDLRLEHNGVLMSWAVPKGPSLDPSIKRFAAQVEDHPIEYGSFEGVIPEGYGAGVVMLWDEGTWEPETPDIGAALAKGDLKCRLDGYKLTGSWLLVRTRGYQRPGETPTGPSWLLIKHRDEWSGDLDITEFAPLSVKSGEDFPAIMAAQDPAFWLNDPKVDKEATGVMLQKVTEQTAELKLAELEQPKPARPQREKKMKRTLVTLAALAAMSVAAPASARQAAAPPAAQPEAKTAPVDPKAAASYVGKWTLDLQSPQGAMQLALDVKIDAANKVTGMIESPNGPTSIAGEFNDGVLGFAISFDAGGQAIEIWFESSIKDGKLAGTMSLGDMGSFPFTGVRAKGL